jgi:hypothetical protein
MSIIGSNILAGASGQAGGGGAYEIERSVRFSSSDSAYLSRTPGSLGNRKTWTWAGWVKRSVLGTRQQLFSAPLSSNGTYIEWQNDLIGIEEYTSGFVFKVAVAAVQRDPSAWYHIVFAFDTTIASPSSDRVKIYINGILQTSLSSSSYPSQNHQAAINATTLHKIGAFPNPGDAGNFYYFNGLLADCFLIDGQALDPTSFGEFDTNGVWQPIEYTGTFGTNGFHLPLSDNSTAAALGTDTSSNGNDWTVNNITPSDGTRYTYNIATMTNEKNDATDSLSHLFDGLLSTTCASINGTDGTITFSPAITGITSLRIHAQGKPGTGYFVVNGTEDYGNSIGDEVYQWITITGVSSLSTIFIRHVTGYSKTTVQAIEVNGVILTDGAAGDSLVDSPTNGSQVDTGVGGEVVGNYCTLNPLDNGGLTLANGNLDFSRATASWVSSRSTFGVSSGKWYWEVTLSTGNDCMAGISKNDAALSSYFANVANGWAYNAQNGQKYNNGAGSAYGDSWVGGNDTVGVAFDADAGSIYFYKNGIVQNSGTAAFTGLTSGPYFPSVALYGTSTAFINFGQRAFAYQTPGTNRPASTYKALCTTNLPEPTIADGSTAMDVVTYTGNGSTQTISGLNFSPDFLWIKRRNTALDHFVWDSVRGITKELYTNQTYAEGTATNKLTSLDSNGFTVQNNAAVNALNDTYVAWTWDAGSSTVTNTQGSITSQVRANASAGFSIVTYTGNGTGGATVGHGLGVTPRLVIVKSRSLADGDWVVTHSALANQSDNYLRLNTTNATQTASGIWSKASTTFGFPTSYDGTNKSGETFVAYCFAPVAGYSAMGSYVGNGSSDGPMVYTGFRIKWLLLKNTTSSGDMWFLLDSSRDPENPNTLLLQPNTSDQELDNATNYSTDLLSNGFKLRSSTSRNNSSGNTFIYIAFAENPLKTARAR